jgi:hypothetical protein
MGLWRKRERERMEDGNERLGFWERGRGMDGNGMMDDG